MTTQLTIALLIFLIPLAYSPGPGNIFFATNGARFGFRSTLALTLGYHLATVLVTIGIGLGFISILNRFPFIFSAIKIIGALYVLWLAWKLFRSGIFESAQEPIPAGFMDGVVLLVLNPKAYFIIAVMFSQFLSPSAESQFNLVIWISVIFTINNFIAFSLWTVLGDTLARVFRNENNAKVLNTIFGLMLAIVAIWMLFI
jgi:threonine/homoserine/homoserine lactone efflux protein